MGMNEWLEMYPPENKDIDTNREKQQSLSRKKLLRMEPQSSLDLHGMTAEEADAALENFLEQSAKKNLRKILIIHGKGLHSEGCPVLKSEVIRILEKSRYAGQFGPADRKNGGGGAMWVLLK